jgi:hypothetical protein
MTKPAEHRPSFCADPAWPACSIRAVEHRADGFVAFEFVAGDSDLYAEMLMSAEAFREFVAERRLSLSADAEPRELSTFPDVRLRSVGMPPSIARS